MANLGPSLEDLLADHQDGQDETIQQKLKNKIREITLEEKEEETAAKAEAAGLPYFNLTGLAIGPDALKTIPKEKSQELEIICFFNNGREIRLGTTDYTEKVKTLEQELKKKLHAQVASYLISKHSFNQAWKLYQTLPEIRKTVSGIEITEENLEKFQNKITDFRKLNQKIKEVSVTEIISLVAAAALNARASDIHFESEEKATKVRFRIDGVLNDVAELPKEAGPKIASRIKHLAGLKINISDKPQDGRFSIHLSGGEKIDVRVSALPTAFGESIVIRLLQPATAGLKFENLGLEGQAFEILKREINRPNGMIVTTGPTGSGKTTTLYSIAKKLNQPETKIITIEDPIEYQLKGINQSQVNKKYTFAKGLKSIVRQDPDVIMVGEIRDLETAEIAVQASLTGHLVLSTIHTNDAFGTIPRFLSMGIKPFLLAPALNVSIGQRLVRKICPNCRAEIELDQETRDRVVKLLEKLPENHRQKINFEKLKFYQGKGCSHCQNLGYHGRIGIFEIVPIERKIEEAIINQEMSENKIKEIALSQGIITMAQDGLLKALKGITSVSEIFRVTE